MSEMFTRCHPLSRFALLALLSLAPSAPATTGGQLLTSCELAATTNQMAPQHHAACQNFITGVMQTHDLMVKYAGARRLYCQSIGVSVSQSQAVFVTWARSHPQYLDGTASELLLKSLHDAFPCP